MANAPCVKKQLPHEQDITHPVGQAQLRMARCREEALAPLEEGVDAPRAELSGPFWKALEYRLLATLIRAETTLDHSSGMAPTVGLLEELPCLGGLAHAHCGCTARPSDLQMAVLCRQDHCNGDDTRCAVAPMQDHVMRWPRWQVPRPTTEYSSRCCRL